MREQSLNKEKPSLLEAIQQQKTISWDDLPERFFDGPDDGRSKQLRNALADLIHEGLIIPVHGIRPAWRLVEYFTPFALNSPLGEI